MQIYISRNNQQLGAFEEAKVLEKLGKGELSATDLAIRHGEQQWQPLGAMYRGFPVSNPTTQAIPPQSKSRSTVRLNNRNNTLQVVEGWANANNFRQISSSGNEKTFQRGTGLFIAPTMLRIILANHELILEVWIRMNFFTRLFSLFILPAEMGIDSGGVRAALPRTTARNLFNQLLTHLGQPLIG